MNYKLMLLPISLLAFWKVNAQIPHTQIEGRLEIFNPPDTTSLYIGKNSGINAFSSSQSYNTYVGANTGKDMIYGGGFSNSVFGSNAGLNNENNENSFFGAFTGSENGGEGNSFYGSSAGRNNKSGSFNSFFGINAGRDGKYGGDNCFYGAYSGLVNISDKNSFYGNYSGGNNKSGEGNAFFGFDAGVQNTSGMYNSVFGTSAANKVNGDNNTLIGAYVSHRLNGSGNVMIGFNAGPISYNQSSTIVDSVTNQLYIHNEASSNPLIYGEFDNELLRVNGKLQTRVDDGQQSYLGLFEETGGSLFGYEFEYNGGPDKLYLWSRGFGGNEDIRMTWEKNGEVGIGTTSPTEKLDVNGNARIRNVGSGAPDKSLSVTADGTLTTSLSDVRLKEEVQTISGALTKVSRLRGTTYQRKDDPSKTSRIGFIAQEIQEVLPEIVFEHNGYLGVNYDQIIPVLLEAIKEQQKYVSELESRISQLENK